MRADANVTGERVRGKSVRLMGARNNREARRKLRHRRASLELQMPSLRMRDLDYLVIRFNSHFSKSLRMNRYRFLIQF